MAEVLRRIWPYIAGMGTAFVGILVLEMVLSFIIPMPSSAAMADPAAIDRAARAMPTAAYSALLVIYIIGSFAGGLTAALAADGRSIAPSIATGIALTIAGVVNVFAMYHPTWFRVASLLTYVPLCYLGCLAARGRRARQ